MGYYCKVFDTTRPNPAMVMTWFNLHDDADDSIVEGPLSLGFNVIITDINGSIVNESNQQKLARRKAEFDAYCARRIAAIELVDQHFTFLRTQAMNYRYPPAAG